MRHFAQQPRIHDVLLGLDQVRRAFPLGPHLHDTIVLSGGGQHGFALYDVNADRFLHVDMGPRFDSRHHLQRVPVIGAADQNNVQLFFPQHLAVIAVGTRDLAGLLPLTDQLGRFGQHPAVHVAHRDDVDGRHLNQPEDVVLAIPPGSNQSHAFRFLMDNVQPLGAQSRHGTRGRRGLQETTAVDVETHR